MSVLVYGLLHMFTSCVIEVIIFSLNVIVGLYFFGLLMYCLPKSMCVYVFPQYVRHVCFMRDVIFVFWK